MQPQITTVAALLAGTAIIALVALLTTLSRKGRTEDEARAYLAGVTYVLSDDPDAAIAELSKAAQLNRQTLETYFALGALFRRKGELDRAIRLHTNMLLRPGLTLDVKRRAQLALAVDYKHSSLRDKAAETLERILSEEPDNREALVLYRQVLEETKDFAKAIELQTRLVRLDGQGRDVLAHLLAAMARQLIKEKPAEAEALAERAVAVHAEAADAQLALGETRLAAGKPQAAAGPLRRAIELEPELAPRALGLLGAALPDAQELERSLLEQIAGSGTKAGPLELALARHYRAEGDVGRARALLRRLIERLPHFWEARKELGAVLLAQDRSEELRADYQEILRTLGQPATGFECAVCQQKLPEHGFRCPACEAWDTIRREANQAVPSLI
jgi:lipopolysaccharide biosynthesis regulator YciM